MGKQLVLLTIGPVGELIQSSRKMKDLAAGSFLLSHLTRCAIERIDSSDDDDEKMQIIFPKMELPSLPNRLLFTIQDSFENTKEYCESIESDLKRTWIEIVEQTFEKKKIELTDEAKEQLSHFLSIHWAFVPYGGDYGKSYNEVVQAMHDVKNTRMFEQLPLREGRRCSLFPAYRALYGRKRNDRFPPFASDLKEVNQPLLKEGECLSGIAMFKRLFEPSLLELKDQGNQKSFRSVAVMLLKHANRHVDDWKRYEKLEDEGSEVLHDWMNGHSIEDIYPQSVLEEFHELKNTHVSPLKKPSPYYALIKLDGDGVGSEYQKSGRLDVHERLSESIATFANEADEMVTEEGGICIFAGGEDVLAFAPIDQTMPLLKKLRALFQEKIKDEAGNPFTLSAGIVFAHLMSPLAPLLERVEELEGHAKDMPGKDAYAIEVQHRGGKQVIYRDKFEKLDTFEPLLEQLGREPFGRSYIANLLETLDPLDDSYDSAIIHALIRRVGRHSLERHSSDEPQEMTDRILELFNDSPSNEEKVAHLVDQLNVISFMQKIGAVNDDETASV